ncbi:hypothetical protein [Mesorhizobium captivum]|uniref:hypothetical protein n=1 Tax=Mesorhizobium captivum TaxID=3072319 RepID=UPI002A24BF8F|nr:hypothetical protein [Mesorhizobium sp. VK3C]MDX8450345.1 hypothetical protein [Mesorhizobium sp. VK3C]
MSPRLTAFAFACLASTGVSAADELLPGNGYSIHLASFDGVIYYTVGQDGFRVVATLASGAEGLPIRYSTMLQPGQRIVLSVPQSVDQPSVDVEFMRDGNAVLVTNLSAGPVADAKVDFVGGTSTSPAVSK